MREVRDVKEAKTALSRMGLYYLLLAVNILPNANVIPDSFPTRNVSALLYVAVIKEIFIVFCLNIHQARLFRDIC